MQGPFFKTFSLLSLGVIALTFAGCSMGGKVEMSYDDAYKTFVGNMGDKVVQQISDAINRDGAKESQELSVTAKNKDFSLDATLALESKSNIKTMEGETALTLNGSFEDKTTNKKATIKAGVDLIMKNKMNELYFTLKEFDVVSDDPAFAMAKGMVTAYKGKTFSITKKDLEEINPEVANLPGLGFEYKQVSSFINALHTAAKSNQVFIPMSGAKEIDGKVAYDVQLSASGIAGLINTALSDPFVVMLSSGQGDLPSSGEVMMMAQSMVDALILDASLIVNDINEVVLQIRSIKPKDGTETANVSGTIGATKGSLNVSDKANSGNMFSTSRDDDTIMTSLTDNGKKMMDMNITVDNSFGKNDFSLTIKGKGMIAPTADSIDVSFGIKSHASSIAAPEIKAPAQHESFFKMMEAMMGGGDEMMPMDEKMSSGSTSMDTMERGDDMPMSGN